MSDRPAHRRRHRPLPRLVATPTRHRRRGCRVRIGLTVGACLCLLALTLLAARTVIA